MGKVTGFFGKLIFGALMIYFLVHMIGGSSDLLGMLISRFPFHREVLEALEEGVGYDISFVPATSLTVIDNAIVLVIAMLIGGGISNTLTHIFDPETDPEKRSAVRGLLTQVLCFVVTIVVASYVFGGVAEYMNESFGGRVLFPIIKMVILALLVLVFIMFLVSVAKLVKGHFSPGLLGYFLIKNVFSVIGADVLCIYALAAIVNEANGAAGPITAIFIVLMLVMFVGRSLGRAVS